jgi:hypothetical protein
VERLVEIGRRSTSPLANSQYDTMSEDQLRAQFKAGAREALDLGIDLGVVLNDEAVH